MSDQYKYLTIWVKETDSIFKTSIPVNEDFCVKHVLPWIKLKEKDFYRDVLNVLGYDGWLIVSTSVPDKNGITRFILSKKV